MDFLTEIEETLAKHHKWDYTDYDWDQIKCVCGWVSPVYSPRGEEGAVKALAAHQAQKIVELVK